MRQSPTPQAIMSYYRYINGQNKSNALCVKHTDASCLIRPRLKYSCIRTHCPLNYHPISYQFIGQRIHCPMFEVIANPHHLIHHVSSQSLGCGFKGEQTYCISISCYHPISVRRRSTTADLPRWSIYGRRNGHDGGGQIHKVNRRVFGKQ